MQQLNSQTTETIAQIVHFLPRMMEACHSLSERLVVPMDEQAWNALADVVEGLNDLYQTSKTIYPELEQIREIRLASALRTASSKIERYFQAFNISIDEDEFIEASDIVRYEWVPMLVELYNQLTGQETTISNDEESEPELIQISPKLFEKNMMYLKFNFPHVYSQMIQVQRDAVNYRFESAKNGLLNLAVCSEGRLSYLSSRYNPVQEAQAWVRGIAPTVQDKPFILLFGFGLGYHITSFFETFPEHNLFIYEPDEQIFLSALWAVDYQETFGKLNIRDIFVGRDKNNRNKLIYRFLKYMSGEPHVLSLPVYDKLKGPEKLEFFTDAKVAIMNYNNSIGTFKYFGMQWVKNSFMNLPQILQTPSIAGWKNRCQGITAVVAGAGPSLQHDIETLKKLKNHALVIAAGSTIQSLLHYGIKPHLIISIDGGEANYNVFKDLDTSDIPFVFTPTIEYHIVENRDSNLAHFFLSNDNTIRGLFGFTEDDPIFDPVQSVTGVAIQLAIYLGCSEVVLTGQDLSYPTDDLYSPGAKHLTVEQISAAMDDKESLRVENVRGGYNRTTSGMRATLSGIEDVLASFQEVKFVNTSQLGAKIQHTKWEPLKAVLSRVHHIHVEKDYILHAQKELSGYCLERAESILRKIQHLPSELMKSKDDLLWISRNVRKLELLSRTNQRKCFELIVEIDKKWNSFVHSNIFDMIFLVVFRNEFLVFEREIADLSKEKDMIKRSKLIFDSMSPFVKNMLDSIPAFHQLLEESARRLGTHSQLQ
ncbi:motility associated factor glycosyltransferase family protein [Cohnella sp. AR92]|uniref:motility associated factor glycosyltransferase family protein n=1 Tax=Cohnella sp. AR92 TaxID=648716 RepID=UPI000F8E0464|nr:6-hydroxymethylpterin diphosphokinase MptE-like protein [Cohnella sp. AR92]RUS43049.1 DUF115 domain-containing protein [Cohnella sp. AR92]